MGHAVASLVMTGFIMLAGCSAAPEEGVTADALRRVSCDPGNSIKTNRYHKAFHDTLAFAEGTYSQPLDGYNVMFTYKTFNDCSKHPDKTVCNPGCSQSAIRRGKCLCSDAAGRYQFKATTWSEIARPLGLKSFTPADQEAGVARLIALRGGVDLPDREPMTKRQFVGALKKLNRIWASLPGSPYGQPVKSAEVLWSQYQEVLPQSGSRTPSSDEVSGNMPAATPSGADSAANVDSLMTALRSSETEERIVAAEALANLGMLDAIADVSPMDLRAEVGVRLVRTFGKLGATASGAERRLITLRLVDLLESSPAPSPATTLAALGALGRAGGTDAIDALQRWLERPDLDELDLAGIASELVDGDTLPGAEVLEMLRRRIEQWQPSGDFDRDLRTELLDDVVRSKARVTGANAP